MSLLRFLWRFYKVASLYLPLIVGCMFVVLGALGGDWLLHPALWGALGLITLMGALFLRRSVNLPARDTHGSASFAHSREIARRGLFKRRGLIIGKRRGRYLRFAREGHLLTFAPTRSGKGVGCVIPNLLDHRGSVVVSDIKGENYRVTARWRAGFSQVLAIAPFSRDIAGACFNPLDYIRTGQPEDVDDAAMIADLLVVPKGQDTFWDSEAQNLIVALLLYAAHDLSPEERNLHHVWSLLMRDRDEFDEVIADMRASDHQAIRRAGDGFSQKEERERSAVISTAQTHMKIWKSPLLADATKHSDFALEDIKRGCLSLYIVIPPELLGVYRPFMRLMVGLAASAMTRVAELPEKRVLFLLDEVAALGRMSPIETGIGYLAGYGVSLWLFFQDLDQLQKTYPKWRSVIANCSVRQAFGVSDYQTAKELSDMLGQRTVPAMSKGLSRDWLVPLPDGVSHHMAETGRPLMTPDEIMTMPEDRQLIFVQALRPILARKIRYFSEWMFRFRV
tara:strand:+ start:6626 stop:8146 length:1521 start_codon:yes stop_codon:yes gene_type:complete